MFFSNNIVNLLVELDRLFNQMLPIDQKHARLAAFFFLMQLAQVFNAGVIFRSDDFSYQMIFSTVSSFNDFTISVISLTALFTSSL